MNSIKLCGWFLGIRTTWVELISYCASFWHSPLSWPLKLLVNDTNSKAASKSKSSGHRPTSCWIHVSGQWNLQILNSGLVLLLQIKTCVSLAFNVDVWLSAFCSSELVWHSFMQVTENQSRTAVWKRGWKLMRATQNLFLHQIEQILCLALLSACK